MTDKRVKDIGSIESLIDRYVFEHGLDDGSTLPPLEELAAEIECDEESLVKTLQTLETKRKVSHDGGVWTVIFPETLRDHSFSFTKSAQGRGLTTEVIHQSVRFPMGDKDHPFYLVEQRVHEALGLARNLPFLFIERLRLLGGHPGALQRAYLNPSRFPQDFFERHDFKVESLIDIYEQSGHRLLSRDTVLAARLANVYEINTLNRYGPSLQNRVVLDAEQRLYAEGPESKSPFIIEFLKASYLENWRYEIKNRPASVLL